ncbi:MAG: hypothetical protein ABEJ56_02505 [Candidatus Nanohaloarchaea archaeon]
MVKKEVVNLFHGTSDDKLDSIDQDGLLTRSERGEVPDLHYSNMVKYRCVYLYDPEGLDGYIKERFGDNWVEVEVLKSDVHVARYGDTAVENMGMDRFLERGLDYRKLQAGELPYSEKDNLMFLHDGNITTDRIVAEKW